MPLPGQHFCTKCMRPVKIPGKCSVCEEKETRAIKGGVFCDHCKKNGANALIYINKKTRKRYCVDCRSEFRSQLVMKGFEPEEATKIMITDFVLLNDPMRKKKRSRK